jgi:hypothetical protein
VRKGPGVRAYSLFTRPPADLAGGTRTDWIDAICGDAADHAEMLNVVGKACAGLSFTYDRSADDPAT